MKPQTNQRGATHIVLTVVALVAVIGALGFVGYNSYQKNRANAGDDTTLIASEEQSSSTIAAEQLRQARKGQRLTFGFQNIGREEKSSSAVTNTIRSKMPSSNVFIGFAEIDSGKESKVAEHNSLKSTFGAANWAAFSTAIPLRNKLDSSWKYQKSEFVKLSNGISGVSPTRYYNGVLYQRDDGIKLAVLNTHFLAGAYNLNKKASLKKVWASSYGILRNNVIRLVKAGYTVVVMGDFNRPSDTNGDKKDDFPKFTTSTQMSATYAFDRIMVTPASNTIVRLMSRSAISTPSGESFHQLLNATLTLEKRP